MTSVVLSPDGRNAYGAGSDGVTLAVLRRDREHRRAQPAGGARGLRRAAGVRGRCRRARALAGPDRLRGEP